MSDPTPIHSYFFHNLDFTSPNKFGILIIQFTSTFCCFGTHLSISQSYSKQLHIYMLELFSFLFIFRNAWGCDWNLLSNPCSYVATIVMVRGIQFNSCLFKIHNFGRCEFLIPNLKWLLPLLLCMERFITLVLWTKMEWVELVGVLFFLWRATSRDLLLFQIKVFLLFFVQFSLLWFLNVRYALTVMCGTDTTDIVDEAITFFRANVFFRNFDIKSPADKLLIYLTSYINIALKRLEGCRTLAEGTKAIINLGLEKVPVPGESGFPFPGLFPLPQSHEEAGESTDYYSFTLMFL